MTSPDAPPPPTPRGRPGLGSRGFTLLEISVTFALLALMLSFVYQTLSNTVLGAAIISEDLEAPKVETAILDEIIRDLRFVYFRQGQLKADAGFWGRSRTPNGVDGDRIDFLTCRESRRAELEDTNQAQVSAPLVEVGYACRPSEQYDRMLELWRREDYFTDDDPTDGGKFDLVYDKIRSFDLTYYASGEEREQGEKPLDEWDSKIQHKLPFAIVLRMTYDVKPPPKNEKGSRANQGPLPNSVRRIILFKPATSVAIDAAMDAGMSTMR